MDINGMCQKCRKRASCKVPCAFVDEILKQDNRPQFHEVNARGLHGEDITILKSKNHRHEVNESGLDYMHMVGIDGDGWDSVDKVTPFTTEADSPWADFQPTLSQTTVFIWRFFMKRSFEEIAEELDVEVATVMSHYQNAKARMTEALKLADSRTKTIAKWKQAMERSEKATGKLPKYMKWLLMNKVFDLTVGEIADLDGTTSATVASKIRVAYDKLALGEYVLLEPTPDDIEAARVRMAKKRASERKRAA